MHLPLFFDTLSVEQQRNRIFEETITASIDTPTEHYRQKILCQSFSDCSEPTRLLSISHFLPADHNDCILANEVTIIRHPTSSKHHQQFHPSEHHQRQTLHYHQQPPPPSSSSSSSTTSIGDQLTQQQSRHHHQQQPTTILLMINQQLRNAFYMSMLPRRKFLSAITLLLLVSIFCLISSSIVDILISSSPDSHVNSGFNIGGNKYSPINADDDNLIDGKSSYSSSSSVYHHHQLQPILLDEIFRNELLATYFNGSWISDQELAFYDLEYNLCLYNVERQHIKKHIDFVYVLTKSLKGLELSADKQYLLWSIEQPHEQFRYSSLKKLKIYDIFNDSIVGLFDGHAFSQSYFQLALWGPKGSQLAFIYDNNLYYKHSVKSETIRLSVTGVPGIIYNAHCDWLYEEEILNSDKALWFSPNGEHLAYLQINDTLVDVVHWNRFGEYYNVTSNQYAHLEMVRYPKPGRHNPQVQVFVVNLHHNSDKIRLMRIDTPKKIAGEMDFYVSRVVWYDDQRILIAWTWRNQRRSLLTICDSAYHWKCQELYDLRSETGWVDGFEKSLLSASNVNQVVVRVPKLVSKAKGEFFHIATINIKDKSLNYLTHGQFDVIELIHYSSTTDEVFYASTLSNHPEVKHIMKTSLNIKSDPVCMTCYLGNSCRQNEAHFNPSGTFYVLECKGYEIPRVEVRSAQTNELIETWEENQRLFQFLQTKFIPRYEKIFVKLADNYDAIVEFILPHDFEEDRKYPMVIELYGAPGTQMIKDKYEMNNWSSYLTSKHKYIYAKIDCRGTSNQGLRHMHQLYKNFGRIEVEDLINVVWFLKTNLTYVDPNRVALWGWSYGGYYSLMALIRQYSHPLFSCAIAVAPVSNWMYYDSAYTEKFLGVPTDRNGLRPYEQSNLLDMIAGLRNKKFMIIFGTDDDNVHTQHSLLLMRQLNQMKIDYDLQIYPDDNHYLAKSTLHLYPRMTKYLQEKCFH